MAEPLHMPTWQQLEKSIVTYVESAFSSAAVSFPFTLHEAAATFVKLVAAKLQEPSLEGLEGKITEPLAKILGLVSRTAVEESKALSDLANEVETLVKKILWLIDLEFFEKNKGIPKNFTLAACLRQLRLGSPEAHSPDQYDALPGLQGHLEWAYDTRNKETHAAHVYPQGEFQKRLMGVLVTMLYAVAEHRSSIECALFKPQIQHLLDRMLKGPNSNLLRHIVELDVLERVSDHSEILQPHAVEMPTFREFEDLGINNELDVDEDEQDSFTTSVKTVSQRGPVLQLVDRFSHAVLIGPPGAGKSTTLRYIAYSWAMEIQRSRGEIPPCPVLISLHQVPAHLSILQIAIEKCNDPQFPEFFAAGRYALLLDGLNEIPPSQIAAIKADIAHLLNKYVNARILITTRANWYSNEFRIPRLVLEPLRDAQIEEFLAKCMPDKDSAKAYVEVLRKKPRLWEYARNPLHLGMLSHIGKQGSLPESRGQLVRQFVKCLHARDQDKTHQTAMETKEILLGEIAYSLIERGALAISWNDGLHLIANRIEGLKLSLSSDSFLSECIDNGLLHSVAGELTFGHELYQEYFAALELSVRGTRDPTLFGRLGADAAWREPILFLFSLEMNIAQIHKAVSLVKPSLVAEGIKESAKDFEREAIELSNYLTSDAATLHPVPEIFRSLVILENGDALLDWWLGSQKSGVSKTIVSSLSNEPLPVMSVVRTLIRVAQRFIGFPEKTQNLGPNLGRVRELMLALDEYIRTGEKSITVHEREWLNKAAEELGESSSPIAFWAFLALIPIEPDLISSQIPFTLGKTTAPFAKHLAQTLKIGGASHLQQVILRCVHSGVIDRQTAIEFIGNLSGSIAKDYADAGELTPEIQACFVQLLWDTWNVGLTQYKATLFKGRANHPSELLSASFICLTDFCGGSQEDRVSWRPALKKPGWSREARRSGTARAGIFLQGVVREPQSLGEFHRDFESQCRAAIDSISKAAIQQKIPGCQSSLLLPIRDAGLDWPIQPAKPSRLNLFNFDNPLDAYSLNWTEAKELDRLLSGKKFVLGVQECLEKFMYLEGASFGNLVYSPLLGRQGNGWVIGEKVIVEVVLQWDIRRDRFSFRVKNGRTATLEEAKEYRPAPFALKDGA